ncbi:MAG: CheR family methyltransferase [Anaeromyxobacteraceae bacterium]
MTARPHALGPLLALVRERAGLTFPDDRAPAVWAAIERAAAAAGAAGACAYADALLAGTAPIQPLLEELTVGETYFFRDPAQWAFIEREVLPAARARHRDERVLFRGWSAGCASGEEPYTLAIVLAEAGLSGRFAIAGTDLSEVALARARRAEYSLWSLRGEPGDRARRHLAEAAGRFRLDRAIKDQVALFQLNLVQPGWPSPARGLADLDLVLCRNVLIYFDLPHVADVARRMFEALAPGGWLVPGAADPPLARHAPFEIASGEHGVAYRRPERVRAVAVPGAGLASAGLPGAGRRELARAPARTATVRRAPAGVQPLARTERVRPQVKDRPAEATPPMPAALPPEDLECARCRALLDAGRLPEALADIDAALARSPLRRALHLQRALVLAELGRLAEAEDAARRALYLDRGAPFLHHFLALLRLQRGDTSAAARGFRTVEAMCSRMGPDDDVPLSEGMSVAGLAAAARYHLARLGGKAGGDVG